MNDLRGRAARWESGMPVPRLADAILPRHPGESWKGSALCAQTDTEAFFPDPGNDARYPKKICAMCSVWQECLTYGLAEEHGVWGGATTTERALIVTYLERTTPPH